MNRTLKALVLLTLMIGGAAARPPARELGLLAETRNKLKNIATALEMWAVDHQGQYPESLDPLVGPYLLSIPQQLDGSSHWNYQRKANSYRLSDRWSGFAPLGVNEEVVYEGDSGLEKLEVPFFPPFQLSGWQRRTYGGGLLEEWQNGNEKIILQLRGPAHLKETLEQSQSRYRQWMSRRHDGDGPAPVGDLQPLLKNGWDLLASARSRRHRFWLVSRGETLLEVMQECDPSCEAQHRIQEVASLIVRL